MLTILGRSESRFAPDLSIIHTEYALTDDEISDSPPSTQGRPEKTGDSGASSADKYHTDTKSLGRV